VHGILYKALKEFVVDQYGRDTWSDVRSEAGVGSKLYLPVNTYEDEELLDLVEATAAVTDRDTTDLLEPFGENIAAHLLDAYGNLVDDDWTALDLVEHTEEHIHTVLRTHNPKLMPPELKCQREEKDRVIVHYQSERNLCRVAIGIVLGVATHYGEEISVSEHKCTRNGDPYCEFIVSV
jgi:predicted hydrocarbon binding protein